jgi:hypothetical protein
MGTKKITKSERRDRILELLAQEGTVEVNTSPDCSRAVK